MSVADAADPVGDNSGADARDDAEKQHERQHFGPARDAVAEIAAIGDDMHLRHRHRDAAGKAGKNQRTISRRGDMPASARAAVVARSAAAITAAEGWRRISRASGRTVATTTSPMPA